MRRAWAEAVVVAVAAAAVVGRGPEPPAWRAATPPGGALVGFAVAGREVVTVDPVRLGSSGPMLRRFDAARGTPLGATPLPIPQGCGRLAVVAAADGERAVVGAGEAAQVYDLHTGRPLAWPVRPHPAGPVALSADGRWLAFGDGDPAAAGASHVTVIDFEMEREPFTVSLPPGTTAADVRFGPRLSVLARPTAAESWRVLHVSLDDDGRPPSVVRLHPDRDWVRFGPVSHGLTVYYAAEGSALHAYDVDDTAYGAWQQRAPDHDPIDRDITLKGNGPNQLDVRLRSWRGRGAHVQRFDPTLTGERTGLPTDSLPHPDCHSVVSLDADGTLTTRPIVPPPRRWWPTVAAAAVPLGLVTVVAVWRAARTPRLRTARRWVAAALAAAAGVAAVAADAARPRWAVPFVTPGGYDRDPRTEGDDPAAVFTPDGREVVVAEYAQAAGDRHAVSLVRLDAATGDLRGRVRLTALQSNRFWRVLSPDGSHAAVGSWCANRTGDAMVFALYDAAGRRLLQFPPNTYADSFSPCGRWLLLRRPADDGAVALTVVAAGDGATVVALPATADALSARFAPDGVAVAVARGTEAATAIELLALPAGRVTRRLDRPGLHELTDWQAGRLFTEHASFDPWGDPAAPLRDEPLRGRPMWAAPACGPGWFTQGETFGGPSRHVPIAGRVYDAATNRLRCWTPRPLPGPAALSRDGRLAACVDIDTGELHLVAMIDHTLWWGALAVGAVPLGAAWAVGRRGR